MRDIGKNIRTLRTRRGLSQDQLAEALHVTRQTVSNYETGRSRPDVEMLTALAEALGADVTEVLYGPAQTDRTARLRRVAAGAVVSALLLALVWWGGRQAADLFERTYISAPFFLCKLILLPLSLVALGWTAAQGALALLNARPPDRPWAAWTRRGILAVLAVWLLTMLPLTVSLIQGTLELLALRSGGGGYSFSQEIPANPISLFTVRHTGLLPPLSFLAGVVLGLLGFPGRRKPPEQ